MTKSSFYDKPMVGEPLVFTENKAPSLTPTRRQPRFSEPAMYDNPHDSPQDTKASFIPISKKEPEIPK
jgi:hypothetical protein